MKAAFTEPEVGVEKVDFLDIALSGVTLNFFIAVDNPNSIGITVKKIRYDMFLEGDRLLKGENTEAIEIDGNKKNVFELPVELFYRGLNTGVAGVLTEDKLDYSFIGDVTLDTPVGDITLDLSRRGEIPVPQTPQFSVTDVTLDEMGLTSTTLTFHIKVENNNEIGFDIRQLDYSIRIHDTPVAEAQTTVNRTLGSDKSMTLGIPVNLRITGFKESFVQTLREGRFKYNIKFNLDMASKYGPYTVPYEKESLVNLY